jgi:hypothetical protein
VEMHHAAGLVFRHFRYRHSPDIPPVPLANAKQPGHGSVEELDSTGPESGPKGVPDDGCHVVVTVAIERMTEFGVVRAVSAPATDRSSGVAALYFPVRFSDTVMHRTEAGSGESGEYLWMICHARRDRLATHEASLY